MGTYAAVNCVERVVRNSSTDPRPKLKIPSVQTKKLINHSADKTGAKFDGFEFEIATGRRIFISCLSSFDVQLISSAGGHQ